MSDKQKYIFRKHSIKKDTVNKPNFQNRMSINAKLKKDQISHFKEGPKSIPSNDIDDLFLLKNIFH